MKRYKTNIIGFTKNNEIVIFENQEEYLEAVLPKKNEFTRIYGSPKDCIRAVSEKDNLFDRICKDIAEIVESYSIEVN